MAEQCCGNDHTLYELLWRDEEMNNVSYYIYQLSSCLIELQDQPDKYKQHNPENGWGNL